MPEAIIDFDTPEDSETESGRPPLGTLLMERGLINQAQLAEADSIWLVSSVRLAAPVRVLNGAEREIDAEFTAALNAWLASLDS